MTARQVHGVEDDGLRVGPEVGKVRFTEAAKDLSTVGCSTEQNRLQPPEDVSAWSVGLGDSMVYTVRGLEDSANWTIVTKNLRVRLARVVIDHERHVAHFSFWRTDGSQRMIELDVSLDLSRRDVEKQIAGALG
jgi:hypothetical protein